MKTTTDPLTAFLYELLRDHVPFGTVSRLVASAKCYTEHNLTCDEMADLAQRLADKLRETENVTPDEGA